MATSTGKTIVLILLVLIILAFAFRMTPFIMAPFGYVSGAFHSIKTTLTNGFDFWPHGIMRITSFSIISILLLFVWIIVIVWVYRDAERRGMNGVLWALLVFIGNLIGLLIYLILRSDNPPLTETTETEDLCPSCEKPVSSSYTFCPHCGKELQAKCPSCNKPVESNWKVCPDCGEKL